MHMIGRVLDGAIRAFGAIPSVWWGIWLVAAIVLFLARHKRSHIAVNAMLIYGLLVLISTVLSRSPLRESFFAQRVNLLATWQERFSDRASGETELLLNFCLLFPLGFLFSVWEKGSFIRALLICLAVTVGIELLQLITYRGFFELNDIIDNIIGAAIGYEVGKLFKTLWKWIRGVQRE